MRDACGWQEGRFNLHPDLLLLKLQKPAADKLTTAEPKHSCPSRTISKRENATFSFFLIKCLHNPQSQEEPLPPRAVTGGL